VTISVAGVALAVTVGALAKLRTGPASSSDALLAMAQVGPQGATLPFDEGAELVIPRGAVSAVQTISIRRVAGGGRDTYGPYAFDPPNLVFERPVRILLPMPPGGRDLTEVVLFSDGTTRRIPARLDPLAQRLEIQTHRFGSWAEFAPAAATLEAPLTPDGDTSGTEP
jgi:hypothetical protein